LHDGPRRSPLPGDDPAGRRRTAARDVSRGGMTAASVGSGTVHVRVRLFAMQREQAGTREVALELASGATSEEAWAALVEQLPVLAPGRSSVRFALNGEYSEPTAVLGTGDELAVIPPVSGGAKAEDGAAAGRRFLEIREASFGPAILEELTALLAT